MVVLFIVLSIRIPYLKELQESAVFVMFGFLGIAFIAYIFNRTRLILHGFACAAALAIFMKSASNGLLRAPEENNNAKISAGHINVSSATDSPKTLVSEILNKDLDVISFQEIKPDWARFLDENLSADYPYKVENVRIDPYGMAIYSKLPIISFDTLYYSNIPCLSASLQVNEDKEVRFLSTMMTPSFNNAMDITQENQLRSIGEAMAELPGTELVLGDFNMVYWSPRIREFRSTTGLENSRRDVSQSVLTVPYDHIFHTPDLECILFKDFVDSLGNRLGIYANYQFISVGNDL